MYEIERKFIVYSDKWLKLVPEEISFIRQGYIPSPKACIRARIYDNNRAELTLKGPPVDKDKRKRLEFNCAISPDYARQIIDNFCESELMKKRYKLKYYGKIWEVDVFFGSLYGLVLAEIELVHEHEKFVRPSWVAEEVTGDERFSNASLAKYKKRLIGEFLGE